MPASRNPEMHPLTSQTGPPATIDDSLRWTVEQQLLHYLAGRDVSCPVCGYNLRALTLPRCPECGQEVTLGVRLVEPYLQSWITMSAAILASAGLGLFIAGIALVTGEWPPMGNSLAQAAVVYFILAIPLGGLALVMRRRLLRLPPIVQWLLATLAVLISLAAFVQFCQIIV